MFIEQRKYKEKWDSNVAATHSCPRVMLVGIKDEVV